MQKTRVLLFILTSFFITLLISCSDNSVTFFVDKPEMLKKDKIAAFYGGQAKKNCEIFRRLYAGFCDTTSQAFITCYDLNDKKYKLSSCE